MNKLTQNIQRVAILCGVLLLVGCGAATAENEQTELNSIDVNSDGVYETITITHTDIELESEFVEVYPYVFSEMVVITKNGDDSEVRELLQINADGVIVEDGDSIGAGITTQAAYAAIIGGDHVLQLVQIDSSGIPVSEPLVLDWDIQQDSWQIVQ